MEKRSGNLWDLIRVALSFLTERRRARRSVELPQVVNRVLTQEKAVALTFDADLTPKMESAMRSGRTWCDKSILDILEHYRVPATFFLSGKWALMHPREMERISANKLFEIGNHGYSHAGFSAFSGQSPRFYSEDTIDEEEVMSAEKLLSKYPSFRRFFRFPSMTLSRARVAFVRRLGYFVVEGDINRPAAHEKNPRVLAKRIAKGFAPGSIIALHLHGAPLAPSTGLALPDLIARAQKKGYRFAKLSDLFKLGAPQS